MSEILEKITNIDGLDTKYRIIKGSSKKGTLLIFHGWGGTSFSWLNVASILADDGFDVVTMDMPGFGETPPPSDIWGTDEYVKFLYDFCKKIKLDNFYLLGHSFGGAIALKFTSEHGSMVKNLILCDAAVIRKERLSFRQKTAKFLSKIGSKIVSKTPFYPLFERIAYKLAGTYDYYRANPIMKDIFKKIIIDDMSSLAEQLKISCLILWGEFDHITPLEDAFILNDLMENSTLKIINNSGHNPHRTHIEETAKIIINYLTKKC
ncbi:MAG: alpha/beta hydrolase [Candidatus Paceibacterota bacterium]|jgi:pimeloyl-ACP methyl ester carboxylesterase|nr:alpha/beta hydrolase [bacterium]